jgi:hypothetical protein
MSAPLEPITRVDRRFVFAVIGLPVILIALIVGPWFVHHWVLGLGAADIHDPATLPEEVRVCGRYWHRSPTVVPTTLDAARAWSGVEPLVVDIAPFAPCSPGLCKGSGAQESCDTVVFVRVGENDYVSFDLEGGM